METVTTLALEKLFKKIGERISSPVIFYLLGGSALCLLGSSRETLDVDCEIEGLSREIDQDFKRIAEELNLDLEFTPLGEFIPLPPEAEKRRRFVGRFGKVEVYIFDLYSIALSKIARGFESDLEDVQFLLDQKLIEWKTLEEYFKVILPQAKETDINPVEFKQYFQTLKRKISK
jgi:Nucleotidyltransferase of unknown function (DUF6036)